MSLALGCFCKDNRCCLPATVERELFEICETLGSGDVFFNLLSDSGGSLGDCTMPYAFHRAPQVAASFEKSALLKTLSRRPLMKALAMQFSITISRPVKRSASVSQGLSLSWVLLSARYPLTVCCRWFLFPLSQGINFARTSISATSVLMWELFP